MRPDLLKRQRLLAALHTLVPFGKRDLPMIDTHCHLDDQQFEADRPRSSPVRPGRAWSA